MLKIECEEYFAEVKAFAEKTGQMVQLQEKLDYLDTYAEHGDRGKTRCRLWKDYAPCSFNLLMERRQEDGSYERWWNGGLIYHGQHDGFGSGSAPTFSTCVTPTSGWSVHS